MRIDMEIQKEGVKAIANDLEVKLPSSSTRPDPTSRMPRRRLTWDVACRRTAFR